MIITIIGAPLRAAAPVRGLRSSTMVLRSTSNAASRVRCVLFGLFDGLFFQVSGFLLFSPLPRLIPEDRTNSVARALRLSQRFRSQFPSVSIGQGGDHRSDASCQFDPRLSRVAYLLMCLEATPPISQYHFPTMGWLLRWSIS